MDAKQRRAVLTKKVAELKEKGYSNSEIGRQLFLAESSVRTLLQAKADDEG